MATQGKKATAAAEQAQAPAAAEPAEAGREEMIAVAAYFRAERRGFAPGNDLEDWLEAERELGEAAAVQEKD
jgi:hypothetical protein